MKDQQQIILQVREQTNFLGYEFLTWLFLILDRKDSKDEIVTLLKGILFKVDGIIVLGTKLVTCLLHHKEQKTSVTSSILEESHEVFASLKNGHVIETLALSLLLDEIKINFTISAHDFAISQLKISNNFDAASLMDEESLSPEDQTREEIFLRMATVRDAESVIDGLYEKFLTVRTDEKIYKAVVRSMQEQVETRLNNYLKKEKAALAEQQRMVEA